MKNHARWSPDTEAFLWERLTAEFGPHAQWPGMNDDVKSFLSDFAVVIGSRRALVETHVSAVIALHNCSTITFLQKSDVQSNYEVAKRAGFFD